MPLVNPATLLVFARPCAIRRFCPRVDGFLDLSKRRP
jgi:hypothetical protein